MYFTFEALVLIHIDTVFKCCFCDEIVFLVKFNPSSFALAASTGLALMLAVYNKQGLYNSLLSHLAVAFYPLFSCCALMLLSSSFQISLHREHDLSVPSFCMTQIMYFYYFSTKS